MSKKVGIVSCYFKNNYGSMLQAYATKKIVDNSNIPNETINIDNNINTQKDNKSTFKRKKGFKCSQSVGHCSLSIFPCFF